LLFFNNINEPTTN